MLDRPRFPREPAQTLTRRFLWKRCLSTLGLLSLVPLGPKEGQIMGSNTALFPKGRPPLSPPSLSVFFSEARMTSSCVLAGPRQHLHKLHRRRPVALLVTCSLCRREPAPESRHRSLRSANVVSLGLTRNDNFYLSLENNHLLPAWRQLKERRLSRGRRGLGLLLWLLVPASRGLETCPLLAAAVRRQSHPRSAPFC